MGRRRSRQSAEAIDVRSARRLALLRAGLLKPEWLDLPSRAPRGVTARAEAIRSHIDHVGYLQLDSVSVAGARSHALVLQSRLEGLRPEEVESLLVPGAPLFEYWGHEASWLPIELYPTFGFRRASIRRRRWWSDLMDAHRDVADGLLARIRDEGPLTSKDLGSGGRGGWWNFGVTKRVANALWSSGELAIAERSNFLRRYDLAERVIPDSVHGEAAPLEEALETLLLKALSAHGWCSTATLLATWRLGGQRREALAVLDDLVARGAVVACALHTEEEQLDGWILPDALALTERLRRLRPRADRGVLLSPFDPLLWDRARVQQLFGFHLVLEIYKPEAERVYGYYCLPVLAGEHLVARVDLKSQRKTGQLQVVAEHFEAGFAPTAQRAAVASALARHAEAVGLTLVR